MNRFLILALILIYSFQGISQEITTIDGNSKSESLNVKVTKWNGQDWIKLGSLMQNSNRSNIEYSDNKYEAGSYTIRDGSTVSYFRKTEGVVKESQIITKNINVFPNPTHNSATIYIDNFYQNEEVTLVLYDYFGREVRRINKFSTRKINLSSQDLAKGIYLLHLYSNDEIIGSGKIIFN